MTCKAGLPDQYREPFRARLILRVAESYRDLIGEPLVCAQGDTVEEMWGDPKVILAHGIEADPVFFFANARALEVFGYDIDTMLRTPSRMSAEAPLREERQLLLDRVLANGSIDDYAGVRIRADGKRFHIERATVWNVTDSSGERIGQAATFRV